MATDLDPATRVSSPVAAVIDVALVLAFAAIGRASHDEAPLAGLGRTAWPFVVALLLGWLVVALLRWPGAAVRTGVLVWLATVAGGMLLRHLSGQGTAASFIVVASIVLGLFLVGWRCLAVRLRP